MSAGTRENDTFLAKIIHEHPVVFDMALCKTFQIAVKSMFPAEVRQRFFPNNFYQNIIDFSHIIMALFHKPKVFFKLAGKSKAKQRLSTQLLTHFFN